MVRKLCSVLGLALASLVFGLVVTRPAHSDSLSAPPAAAETSGSFTVTKYPLPGGHVQFSSSTLADLDGDSVPEVIVGTTACRRSPCIYDKAMVVVAMRGNGTLMWSRNVDAPVNSKPAVGDINNDGFPEVVVTLGGDVSDINHHGGAIAFDRNGNQLWRMTTIDHLDSNGGGTGNGYADGVFSSPALCDLDGDLDLEIVFGAWDHRIYVLDHNGNSLWYNKPGVATGPGYVNADTVWSSPACADLNNDGQREIIIGADITGGGFMPDGVPTQNGGFIHVLDLNGNSLVRRYLSEAVYSSPAIGDLDNDGDLEIVVGTSFTWWQQTGGNVQPYVYAFTTNKVFGGLHFTNPAKLPAMAGWPKPTTYPGFSSPALADLDGDNDLEVIIGTGHPTLNNDHIPGDGRIHAWHHNGQNVAGFPVSPQAADGADGPIYSSPIVADVDDDGGVEILFSMIWDVYIYNANGSFQERLGAAYTVVSSPSVGDTDNDQKTDIWIGGSNISNDEQGYLWHWEHSGVDTDPRRPWPMFGRDKTNASIAVDSGVLRVSHDELFILHQRNSNNTVIPDIRVENPSLVSFSWNASATHGAVSVSPGAGFLDVFQSDDIQVNMSLPNTLGTHPRGNIVVTASAGASLISGSPVTIPVTVLTVPTVYRAYIPGVLE